MSSQPLSIGFSLFLIAVGAILAWAVNATVTGIDIHVVGAILMLIGCVGLALSLLFWASFAPFADRAPFRRRILVSTAPPPDRVIISEPATTIVREVPLRDPLEPR